MRDRYDRTVTYLRLSVTDLCSFRCRYCMPAEGVPKRDHKDICSVEELVEIARAAADCGVRKVRLTGGEPLVRRGILEICRGIAAIPEVDKLITLARKFDVPVGVLLGVEEPQAPEAEALTDGQLDAVEQIVGRYLAAREEQERQKPKRRRWPRVLAAVVIVAVVWWTVARISGLQNRIDRIDSNLGNLQNTLSDQVSRLSGTVQNILEENASLLAEGTCTPTAVDPETETLLLTASVTPKRYTEGMTATLVAALEGGRAVTGEMTQVPGTVTFTLEGLRVPLADPIKLSVQFTEKDGTVQTAALETLCGWGGPIRLNIYSMRSGSTSFSGNVLSLSGGSLEAYVTQESQAAALLDLKPVELEWQVYFNGKQVEAFPVKDFEWPEGQVNQSFPQDFNYRYEVEGPGVFSLVLYWKDSLGQTGYICAEREEFTQHAAGDRLNWESDYSHGDEDYDPVTDTFTQREYG